MSFATVSNTSVYAIYLQASNTIIHAGLHAFIADFFVIEINYTW